MNREIKLSKLETRFLFNFILEENNKIRQEKNLDLINLNNVDGSFLKYKKKIQILKNKLEKLDKKFYS